MQELELVDDELDVDVDELEDELKLDGLELVLMQELELVDWLDELEEELLDDTLDTLL